MKRKLISLVSDQGRTAHDEAMRHDIDIDVAGRTSNSDTEITQNLRQVIEGRLWTMMQLSLYDPLAARRLLPHSKNTGDLAETGKEAITDTDMDYGSLQEIGENLQHQEHDIFSFLADDFDDRTNDIPSEVDYNDFEALLEENLDRPLKDEFEDLFGTGQPVLSNNTDDAMLEDYDMDIDSAAHDGREPWLFAPGIRHRPAFVESHFEGWDTQIDNQSMLV